MSKVYVFVCEGQPYVKIGVAAKVESRIKSVQSGCPFRLSVGFETGHTKPEIATQVEATAHKLLTESRMSGEWFDCGLDEAVEAIHEARKRVRTIRASRPKRGPTYYQLYTEEHGEPPF